VLKGAGYILREDRRAGRFQFCLGGCGLILWAGAPRPKRENRSSASRARGPGGRWVNSERQSIGHANAEPDLPKQFHRQCWRVFTASLEYRHWRRDRSKGRLVPFPMPKLERSRGRPSDDPQKLWLRYECLIRRAAPRRRGGMSLSAFARQHSLAKGTLSEAVE